VPLHVVLLTRDTSLAVALRALVGEPDQVIELAFPNAWRTLNGSSVDAVVVDLPPAMRKAAVEALERNFTGPLVVLLDPGEELAKTANQQRCSALHRPFSMSALWTLLVPSAPEATRDTPEPPPVAERATYEIPPAVKPPGDGASALAETAPAGAPTSDTAAARAGGDEQATSLMDTTMWDEADEGSQTVATRLARRLRLDVVATVVATVIAGAMVLRDVTTPARIPVLLAFAIVVPGLGWAYRLRLPDRGDTLLLAMTISVCLLVVVGESMALLRLWSVPGGFLVLAAIALLGVALPPHLFRGAAKQT
jgi:hypothetical protein